MLENPSKTREIARVTLIWGDAGQVISASDAGQVRRSGADYHCNYAQESIITPDTEFWNFKGQSIPNDRGRAYFADQLGEGEGSFTALDAPAYMRLPATLLEPCVFIDIEFIENLNFDTYGDDGILKTELESVNKSDLFLPRFAGAGLRHALPDLLTLAEWVQKRREVPAYEQRQRVYDWHWEATAQVFNEFSDYVNYLGRTQEFYVVIDSEWRTVDDDLITEGFVDGDGSPVRKGDEVLFSEVMGLFSPASAHYRVPPPSDLPRQSPFAQRPGGVILPGVRRDQTITWGDSSLSEDAKKD